MKTNYYVPDERPWFKHYHKSVPHHLDYPKMPLYQFLDDSAKKYPDKTALVFYGKEISYRELKELSDKFAFALQNLGIQKGDRVAFLLPNCPQFVIGFYGVLKTGATAVPLNPSYTGRELKEFFDDSGTKTIIAMDVFYSKINEVKNKTELKDIILIHITNYFPFLIKILAGLKELPNKIKSKKPQGKGIHYFQKLLKESSSQYHSIPVNPKEDLAVLQYTGGTTGKPKGVMLTHKNLVANTIQLKHWFPLQAGEETIIGLVPFFHIGGITSSLTWGFCRAAKIIVLPRFHTKPTLRAITKYKATAFFGVPAIYIALNKTIEENKGRYKLDSLKLTGVGTAPCPRDLFDLYKRKYGKGLIEGYGLTENAGVTFQSVNNSEMEYRPGSVGFPFPDTGVKIIDIKTKEILGPNKAGEICLKGPHITIGYWNRPEENEKTFKNGWLHTGDIAKMDEDGYFYILGRKDDVINIKGFQVYPREIENVLEDTDLVAEAAVISIPDYYAGQKIIAYVISENGKNPTEKELLKICRDKLIGYKVPTEIKIRKKLPRSSVRKILKYVLRKEAVVEEKN